MKLGVCILSVMLATNAASYTLQNIKYKSEIEKQRIEESTEETKYINTVDLPSVEDNSFKAYMDYRCITDTSSIQYEMQLDAYTDENGLRKIGEYYCVAMGSGICSNLGKKYEVELESGETFKVIQADQKSDRHTDSSNKYIDLGNGRVNIVEFIVCTEELPDIVQAMGNIEHMPSGDFEGKIVSIKELRE